MRRGEQPGALELGHDRADRGGGEVQPPGQRLRADRRAVREIGLDHPPEDRAGTLAQIVEGRAGHRGQSSAPPPPVQPCRPAALGPRRGREGDPHATQRTRAGRDARNHHRDRLYPPCRRLVPDRLRRHPRAVHRQRRGAHSALAARQGGRLGDRRILDAPARHPHARQPRGGARPSRAGGRRKSSG